MTAKDQKLEKMEAKDYLILAEIYLEIAEFRGKKKEYLWGVVDAAYNSAELCAKGLLALKLEEIPSTHGGVVQKFSQFYIKTNILKKELGRIFQKALRLRNIARYEVRKEIIDEDTKEVLELTKKLIKFLKRELK